MKITHRFLIIAAVFITCIITANVIAVKVISIGPIVLPAAIIVFPLSYIFGDIITEVYGYHRARQVIWLAYGCNLLFVAFVWIAQVIPGASFWENQQAYESILGVVPRFLLASFAGGIVGEFANSFVLSRMKVLTRGRWLWMRTIASTIIGQGLDTALFIVIAYYATPNFLPIMILYHWLAKTAVETLATPLTYLTVGHLKQKEEADAYDKAVNYNPFAIKEEKSWK
ncbi:MAG: queuosine precursor transporter [Dehalococcoidales bacterium]|nr:queuosine precursor transporter [Dehalococcoidales bacterium]